VRIDVCAHSSSSKNSLNSIKPAFNELLNKGIYSDLEIVINGESMRAHKCILIARSEKFKKMLQLDMKEHNENRVVINNEEINP
jgi:hypothetical protein